MRRGIVLLMMITWMMATPVKAQELEGNSDSWTAGRTSVTAYVEAEASSETGDDIRTGDESRGTAYLSLFLMSGIVILANRIGSYRKES